MRPIDADQLERHLKAAIILQESVVKALEMQNDEFAKGGTKGVQDILKGVEEMETMGVPGVKHVTAAGEKEMKTLNLVKEYGGIDEVIEEVKRFRFVLTPEFAEVVLYALQDYKKLKKEKKLWKKKLKDDSWPDLPTIGDRHEMGG